MAIITDYIDDRAHVYEQQYVNVHQLTVQKAVMQVEVGIHKANNGEPPHTLDTIREVPFDMNSDLNPWQQAYIAIKQRWPDSTDC